MSEEIPFTKMQGTGNDFILIELKYLDGVEGLSALAVRLCDRHFGIGADGLIVVRPPRREGCALGWQIFNPDGSEAEMCGNGIRCLTVYARDNGLTAENSFRVDGMAGIVTPTIMEDGTVKVDMGRPELRRSRIPMKGQEADRVVGEGLRANGDIFSITAVNMGNPHCVIFVDEPESIDLERVGPAIERHPSFPQRTNVEFVKVERKDSLRVRVWERGAGITLACGTGACASVVAGVLNGLSGREAAVTLPGGALKIRWDEKTDHIFMQGPAQVSFRGFVRL